MLQGDDLSDRFRELIDRQSPVRLVNAFRGLPIIQPAYVRTANHRMATFEVHPHQLVCMHQEGQTHLIAENIPFALQARVFGLEVRQNWAILADFRRASNNIGKRFTVRLQPAAPVEVLIYDGDQKAWGNLVDISMTGVGVSDLRFSGPSQKRWEKGRGVFISFKLPHATSVLHFKGKIANRIPPQGEVLQRVGITILTDCSAREALQGYITQRQSEILTELNQLHAALFRQQSTPSV